MWAARTGGTAPLSVSGSNRRIAVSAVRAETARPGPSDGQVTSLLQIVQDLLVADPVEELAWVYAQSAGDGRGPDDADVPLAALNVADCDPIDTGGLGKGGLCESGLLAQLTHAGAEVRELLLTARIRRRFQLVGQWSHTPTVVRGSARSSESECCSSESRPRRDTVGCKVRKRRIDRSSMDPFSQVRGLIGAVIRSV